MVSVKAHCFGLLGIRCRSSSCWRCLALTAILALNRPEVQVRKTSPGHTAGVFVLS